MLPKKRRLTTHLFDQVFKNGKIQHSERFWIRSFLLPDLKYIGFAVATSKKVAKTAIARNSIKRLVYKTIENTIPSNHKGYGVIVGVKKDISKLNLQDIVSELSVLLKKV